MRSRPRVRRIVLAVTGVVFVLALAGCADGARTTAIPTAPLFAKTASGPAVRAATPAFGRQGQVSEQVSITGTGFAPGAVASWEDNGLPTGKVVVRLTQFVSSTELVATIDIAADADLALYDIAVTNGDRKKGIGTELFEVTTALALTPLGTNSDALAGNDKGEAVGFSGPHAFYWNDVAGTIDIGGSGAYAIDEAGATIVGRGIGAPVVWTRSGSGWALANLPKDPAAVGGRADAIASDAVTGVATVIGGSEEFPSRNYVVQRPRLWKWTGSAWQKVDLALPSSTTNGAAGWVTGVTLSGQAVGVVSNHAVVWEADGSSTVLGDGGFEAINRAGTIVVGFDNSAAVYYRRNAIGDAWSGPFLLPGGCSVARGVDDVGRIVTAGCKAPVTSRLTSAVIVPPYTSALYLSGLGDVSDGGSVGRVPSGGTYFYGSAPSKSTRVAVRWRNPL